MHPSETCLPSEACHEGIRKAPGGTQEASKRHPGGTRKAGTWEAPGGTQEARGDVGGEKLTLYRQDNWLSTNFHFFVNFTRRFER